MLIKHCPPLSGDYNLDEGGAWYNEAGEQICKWRWLPVAKIMQVFIGNVMRPVRLGDIDFVDDDTLTEDVLRAVLPLLARSTAEDVTGQKYKG